VTGAAGACELQDQAPSKELAPHHGGAARGEVKMLRALAIPAPVPQMFLVSETERLGEVVRENDIRRIDNGSDVHILSMYITSFLEIP
jgi:hypothetical protein